MRVPVDELDYSDQHIYLYEGQPFTGIAYEALPDGQVVAEEAYVDGGLKGLSREWYPTGALKSEGYYKSGAPHSAKEWCQDGILNLECLYEYAMF